MRRVPWFALGIGILAGLGVGGFMLVHRAGLMLPPCPMKVLTGLPCAACGSTRCLLALGAGRWGEAFHWHPVLLLMFLALPLVAGWDLRRAWRNAPYPALPDSPWWRGGVWVLFLGTWAMQILRGI